MTIAQHSSAPVSPLSHAESVVIEQRIPVEEIVLKYSRYLGIDVQEDLKGCSHVLLCRGCQSNIRFFWPPTIAGNARFYEKLMHRPSYYLADKWEYRAALEMLAARQRVVEVGCGTGDFLGILQQCGHEPIGLEINDGAIRDGVAKGLDIRRGRIEDFADEHHAQCDALCAFQVLEHVADPWSFIESGLRCLRVGGLAIFAVPNGDGIFASLDVALDMPPHHMLRWNAAAFQYLTQRLPIVLESLSYEPLSKLHVGMLATTCFNHLSLPQRGWQAFRRKIAATLASAYWNRYFAEVRIPGNTLLVVFRKVSE